MPQNSSNRSITLRSIPVVYGCLWGLFIALIGTLIVFLLAQYGGLQAGGVTVAAYITHCFAVLFGGIAAARQVESRGWFHGGLTGLLYALFMISIGLFVYNTFTMDASGLFRVLLMAVIGAFGGMIGTSTR
ncbi:TIGR04086 family membrane protein [Alicyclobacillus acidiphilus]|uniref:TIGR04086 family membrane protein n=1 Tax=Alicyclobacillus acidiphilus TaxID=182455 RepID=UPI00082FAB3F|nr:TIGR04086 family membrane protein [Alicyclobacillus acidiphilus]